MTQMQIDFVLKFLEFQIKASFVLFILGLLIFFASIYFTKNKTDE